MTELSARLRATWAGGVLTSRPVDPKNLTEAVRAHVAGTDYLPDEAVFEPGPCESRPLKREPDEIPLVAHEDKHGYVHVEAVPEGTSPERALADLVARIRTEDNQP